MSRALEFAYSAADGQARRDGDPINAEAIGKAAAETIRRTTESMSKGGLLDAFRLLRPDTLTLNRVRSALVEARRPTPELVERSASRLAEWRAEIDARGNRQTDALEGLLRLAERQAKGAPLLLVLMVVSAVAAVVAAVAALIAL